MDLIWLSSRNAVAFERDSITEALQETSLPGDRKMSLIALVVCSWSLIEAPLEFVLYPDVRWLMVGLLCRLGLLMSGAIVITRVRSFYRVFATVCGAVGLTGVIWSAFGGALPTPVAAISMFDFAWNGAAALAVFTISSGMRDMTCWSRQGRSSAGDRGRG
jgi:hypothetical protein